jgi:hypothetical protein
MHGVEPCKTDMFHGREDKSDRASLQMENNGGLDIGR